MKRFLARVGRFFWSLGFLKFVLWTVTIIVLFYVEEDWRGARAWAATKAMWEARGETFDFDKLIPPAVPDDQNLGAIPLFKMEPDPDPEYKGNLEPLTLRRALRINQPGEDFWGLSNLQSGMRPDLKKIDEQVALDYAEVLKRSPADRDALGQFDALFPFLADLRAAAASRPYCRFQQNYRWESPYNLFISLYTSQFTLSRILAFHAVIALGEHQPNVALNDVKTSFKLTSGLNSEPLLAPGLCAMGANAVTSIVIGDGLATHSWNDAQLSELEVQLGAMDFLATYQSDMRGECFGMTIPAFDLLKSNRPGMGSQLNARNQADISKRKTFSDRFPRLWADGWIDWMKVQAADSDLNAVGFVDAKARLVFPDKVDSFAAEMARRQRELGRDVWHLLTDEAAGPIVASAKQFAEAQVDVDEARIAVALERYRLAHGSYPESLDVLAPAFINEVPHDVMNGAAYHYKAQKDGTYLLYSVGWNQKDDGGVVTYRKDLPKGFLPQRDYEQGDWPWIMPK